MNNLSAEQLDAIQKIQRPPESLMKLSRLGCFHASRLSFMRVLLRALHQNQWQFNCQQFNINQLGEGYAVYTAKQQTRCYSLVAFAHNIPDEMRSDRVIAEQWDCTFALFDGIPDKQDIDRLQKNVPLQEAGRISEKELSLSRANRSGRLWQYVIDCLSQGQQPKRDIIEKTGYLMRTTAVYGSGKFGAADRETIADRDEFIAPFQVEMLHVYLIRWFVRDLANYMAKLKGQDKAVELNQALSQLLGIGNSTGLGMAPFIVNHPDLFNNWISAREFALARVRLLDNTDDQAIACFLNCFKASITSVEHWQSQHPLQIEKLIILKKDIAKLNVYLNDFNWQQHRPWNALFLWAQKHLQADAQEWLASLLLEPHGKLIDDLSLCMAADTQNRAIDKNISVKQLRQKIENYYTFAINKNWEDDHNRARVWYISEEKLEPRLGERLEENLDDYEQPLCPAKTINQLYNATLKFKNSSLANFLLRHPQFRDVIKRVLRLDTYPYAEIRDNTLASDMLPIDMLRCKLSFFGATHFDPRSDRWVRIVMFQHAPYPDELDQTNYDFWPYHGLSKKGVSHDKVA